ncbi:hypothetical protein EJ08DRAFT_121453 [Tothia fuscella]|uniref:Uncharacterized protein n=1 Tax=Tothia fuscella TaxID=1048955 RepID=A0A9P4TZI2_9PEZI|nr:hypothetical protein EJ08DRAFT_121453 [Tothia fuscella]
MKISSGALLISPLFLASTQASAVPEKIFVARAVNCKAVTGVLAIVMGLGAPATSFCSSFIHIPATTTKFTTTTPSTTTTTTTTVTSGVCPAAKKVKRDPLAEPEISSACSCLSIQPKVTTTSTSTAATWIKTTTTIVITCSVPPKPVCTPNGSLCEFFNPGACCSGKCCNYDEDGIEGPIPQCCPR